MLRPAFLSVFLCSGSMLSAQSAKPDDVYQVTESLMIELKQMNVENFSASTGKSHSVVPAQPRHVFFLALDNWRKLHLLRFMNGLEAEGFGNIPVRKITPGDVKTTVDQLLSASREMRAAYGLGTSTSTAARPSGKTPTDVYANLLRISDELEALGVPATVPNDVFRVANSISDAMNEIALKHGITVDVGTLVMETGKTPAEAFAAGRDLLASLKALGERDPGFEIDGGIQIPDQPKTGVSPDHVIRILLRAKADVFAMTAKRNVQSKMKMAPYVGGKTPSDVFNEIKRAQMIVDALGRTSS